MCYEESIVVMDEDRFDSHLVCWNRVVCLFALVVIGIRNLDAKNIVLLDKWVLEILIGVCFAFAVKLFWARDVFRLMANPSFMLEVVHIIVLESSFSWALVLFVHGRWRVCPLGVEVV